MAGCGKSVSSGTSKLKLSFRALKLRLDYELRHMYTGLRSSLDHVDVFDVRRNVDAAAFSSLAFIRNVAFCSRRRINTLVYSTLAATAAGSSGHRHQTECAIGHLGSGSNLLHPVARGHGKSARGAVPAPKLV